jgi:beta-glucanase (GH16 family)
MQDRRLQTPAKTGRGAAAIAAVAVLVAFATASAVHAAPPIGQTIWIRASANGQFVSADLNSGAEAPLFANRTSASGWEQFTVVDGGSGFIALRASANGLYVSADQGRAANAPLVANRATVGDWERFTWTDVAGGFTLRGRTSGRFVSADLNLGGRLVGDRTTAGGWETFSFGTGSSPTPTPAPTPSGWRLVWADEFNGAANTSVDTSRWNIATGDNINNHELQMYTNRTQDLRQNGQGQLVITANRGSAGFTCWNGPCQYTSGRINTAGKFQPTYGRFEARIRVPVGQGMWPAFWLLGANDNGCGGWPNCGEIDIMENLGSQPSTLHGTVHGPGYSGGSGIGGSTNIAGRFTDGFHVFAVEWEPNTIRWYLNGNQYFSINNGRQPGAWVFNHGYFLILNLAVGGDWPGSPNAQTVFPQSMLVDYVRVYQR